MLVDVSCKLQFNAKFNGYPLCLHLFKNLMYRILFSQNIELDSQSPNNRTYQSIPPPISQITQTLTRDPLNLSLAGLWPGMRSALTNQSAVLWPSDQWEAGARTGSECHLSSSALRQAKQRPSNTHRRHRVGAGECQLSVIRVSHTWRLQCAVLQSGPSEDKHAAGRCRSRFSDLMFREIQNENRYAHP